MDISSYQRNHESNNIQIVLAGPTYCFTTVLAYRNPQARRFLYFIEEDMEAHLMEHKSVPAALLDKLRAKHGPAIQAAIICTEDSPHI